MDGYELAQVIAAKPEDGWRWVQGTVVSVQSYSITVTLAGGTANVAGVKYLAPVPPLPGAGVWMISNGKDLLAVGMTAASARSISPRAYRTTDQTLTTGVDTVVTFEADEADDLNHWVSGSATRLTAIVPGRYLPVASVRFAANGTGFRAAWIVRNGSTTLGRAQYIATAAAAPTWFDVVAQPTTLAVGDYLELTVSQNSGGNLALSPSGNWSVALSMSYLGP